MKYKFHVPTQQYGFLEIEGEDLEEMEVAYNKYAEDPINFNEGKFVEVETFTGEKIRYNDLTHKYTDIDGNILVSASQYAKKIKPPFPKEVIIPKVAKKYDVKEKTIESMWSDNGKVSLTFGNAIHYSMEQWFKYKDSACDEKEYNLPKHPFLKKVVTTFPDKDHDILPEVVVSDVKNKMVGRADGLDRIKKEIVVIDYKSDADIKKNLKFHFMQLSFYATMLRNHGYKVDKVIVWNYTTKWTKYESEVLDIEL